MDMIQHQSEGEVPRGASLYSQSIMLPPLPDKLDQLNWSIVLKQDDDTLYLKDTISKTLTDREHEAVRFTQWSSVEEELKYWHNKNRPGYQPFHRTAQPTLLGVDNVLKVEANA